MAKEIKNEAVENFIYYLRAGYPYFYVSTYEMGRCIELLSKAVNEFEWGGKKSYKSLVWDALGAPGPDGESTLPPDAEEIINQVTKADPGTVVFLKNFNWFLFDEYDKPNKNVVTMLQNMAGVYSSRAKRKVFVVVSDVPFEQGLPDCLVRDFISINFELPSEEELGGVLDTIIDAVSKNDKFQVPDEKRRARLVDAALGLTLAGAENAFATCLVKQGALDPSEVDRIKANAIEKVAGVYYKEYDMTFDQLKGYDNLKRFVIGTINHPNSKGIILLGPAGTGKTAFAQCLANETGKRMVTVEMAEFQGGIVGETERKYREAISAIKAMSGTEGVIVFVDELEKGLAGIGGGMQTVSSDSITKRGAGQWLKFMQNPECRVYFIATCNDIRAIPPEYLRAERWDTAPFFVDLPNEQERKAIFEYYLDLYGSENGGAQKKGKGKKKLADIPKPVIPKELDGWSGAEIRAVCRIADMMGVPVRKAMDFVVPVSETMKEEIEALRKWKDGRTIPATTEVGEIEQADTARYIDFVHRAEKLV